MKYTCFHCNTEIDAGKEVVMIEKGNPFHEKCYGLKDQISLFELLKHHEDEVELCINPSETK